MDSARLARLFIVATPIGNLEDLTPRARRVLSDLNHIIAEDTREARKLFELSNISTESKKFLSFAAHNMKASNERAINLLRQNIDLALISDRGTPGISDPGAMLVFAARAEGFTIIPIPGACSVTTALSVSGLDASRSLFLGFLPHSGSKRQESMEQLRTAKIPVCLLEAPHRIRKTVLTLKELLPDGMLFLARELTKRFETLQWGRLMDIDVGAIPEMGEFTLVISNTTDSSQPPNELEKHIEIKLASDKAWAKAISKMAGVSAQKAYNSLQLARTMTKNGL